MGNGYFYPRSPCGERPSKSLNAKSNRNISIHALLAESDGGGRVEGKPHIISIHALLAESDGGLRRMGLRWHISIHALLAESDEPDFTAHQLRHISIHALLAESDWMAGCKAGHTRHFYPRSPCGERQQHQSEPKHQQRFLSTLSLRRATYGILYASCDFIHFYPRSPCGERHVGFNKRRMDLVYFYPRSPCGERHAARRVWPLQ